MPASIELDSQGITPRAQLITLLRLALGSRPPPWASRQAILSEAKTAIERVPWGRSSRPPMPLGCEAWAKLFC